ncbi:hypothetical protein BJP39_02325 [Streptomyces sp. CC77]|nr:hypothetical protein BJP39_02325 [Streptomyces sp. CC77]
MDRRRRGAPPCNSTRTAPGPLRSVDFAAATGALGTDLVLLDGHPGRLWHLAHTFRHVYVDVGPTGTGSRGAALLADALDAALSGKLLCSSGAHGLPERHVVAALGFREALGRGLGECVRDGVWSRTDAQRVATMIATDDARRVYGLDRWTETSRSSRPTTGVRSGLPRSGPG